MERHSSARNSSWFFILTVALAMVFGTQALAQLKVGNLYVKVITEQAEPLPGVTVTLTGVGAPNSQITNAEGQARFLGLAPGHYELTVQLEGFATVDYPDVSIRVGRNTIITVTMAPAIEEEVTVVSESPLLDERKLGRGTTVTQTELDKIPTARDPWALLTQVPGVTVDRINVGGNESGEQSLFVGPGSHSNDNAYALDGVVITDMDAIGSSPGFYDFESLEEVRISTGGTDIALATGGVTLNLVTRRGSNDWRGSARWLTADSGTQSSSGFDAGDLGRTLSYQLPGTVRPGTMLGQTDISPDEIDEVTEAGIEVGGNILRDRLWFWGAYAEQDIANRVSTGELDATDLENLNAKVNAQLSAANSAVFLYSDGDKLKDGRGAGPQRPPETTWDQSGPTEIWKLEDTHLFDSDLMLTGMVSGVDGSFLLEPQGGLDTQVLIDAGGSFQRTFALFEADRDSEQWRLDGSYFFNTGDISHQLRFGTGLRQADTLAGSDWGGGAIVLEFFGPGSVNLAQVFRDGNPATSYSTEYQSFWLQDTFTTDRLTVAAGLRYDLQDGRNNPSSIPASELLPDLLPPLTFGGNDAGGLEFEEITPRIAVTYALGQDRETLIRGGWSRFAQQLHQGLITRSNPLAAASALVQFFDFDGDLEFDPAELLGLLAPDGFDPANPTALTSVDQIAPDLSPELTDEVNLGVEHAFRPNLVAGAHVTWRRMSDLHERAYLVRDPSSGAVRPAVASDFVPSDPVVAVSPNSRGIAVPTFSLVPEPTGGELLRNGDREQDYLGLTLSVEKRLSDRWMLRGHLTFYDWEWDIPSSYFYDANDLVPGERPETSVDANHDFDNDGAVVAQLTDPTGDTLLNSTWSFNVNGLVQIAPDRPWSFNVAGNLSGREGYPLPYYLRDVLNPGDGFLRDLQVTGTDAFRGDDVYSFDLRIDKEFRLGSGLGLTLSVDAFNIFNEGTVLQRERSLPQAVAVVDSDPTSPTFGQPVTELRGSDFANFADEVMSPRIFRFGLRLHWK